MIRMFSVDAVKIRLTSGIYRGFSNYYFLAVFRLAVFFSGGFSADAVKIRLGG